jgi:PKD repeat protein
VLLASFVNVNISSAQCPITDFTIQNNNTCLDENIELANTSTGNTFLWDFCSEDLLASPSISESGVVAGSSQPFGFTTVKYKNNFYSFVTNRNTNTLLRLEYGASLENSPSTIDLGNPGNLLSSPEDIDIVNIKGNWYALITLNLASPDNKIVLYEFGMDLLSNPVGSLLGNFGVTSPFRGISAAYDGTNIILALAQSNFKITLVNYRDSFSNPIGPTDIITTNNLTNATTIYSIDIYSECDQWYVLCSSTNYIHKLYFNNNLFQAPVSEVSYFHSNITDLVFDIDVINEGGKAYLFIGNLNSPCLLFDLGDLSLNLAPILVPNASNPTLTNFSIVYDKGEFILTGIDRNVRKLARMNYKSTCGVSLDFSIDQTPLNVSYSLPGNHAISLNSYDLNGNNVNTSQPITISPSLAPQTTSQITGNCLSSPLSFDAQQLSGAITAWNWDFGDGIGTSTLQNDTYTYTTAGNYPVKLSITDANGCNNLYIDTARVYNEPTPNFTFPAGNLCMNNSIAFSNTTTGESGPVVSWTWDFNGEGNSTERDPTFTFLTPGSKTITLTSSIPGCANVTQQTITIEEAPITTFGFDNVCNSQTTTFTDFTTGNNLTTWNWDFGDGTNSTIPNPVHTYTNPGKYVVTLTVGNNLGCSTTKVDTVFNHAIPVVSFTNDLPCSTTLIQFTDQSSVQDANIVAWEWDFGDGNTSIDRNPQYTYNQTGDFTVQLKAYSQYGCVDSLESVISVIQGPEANFSWNKGCVGEPTTFTDLTNSFGQPITGWTWLIDNKVFNQQNPQYSFASAGTYSVVLSVSTANLCAQTITWDIIINDSPLTSFSYTENCGSSVVMFYDTTPPSITAREWRIDGLATSSDSVMNVNINPNNYTISLATTSATGCTQTLIENINIIGAPVANYIASTNYGAAPLSVQFSNQSTGTDGSFWQFGDPSNSTSTEVNPRFEYTTTGTFNVVLIATGGVDCGDTTIQTIEVVEPEHTLSIDAITPISDGKLALTLSNLGSITYHQNNCQLLFTLDNGAEITEPFNTTLYPLKTINYVPNFTIGEVGNAKTLCVELRFFDNQTKRILDEDCISLSGDVIDVTVYPNPATDYINLAVVLNSITSISIRLIDSSGALLYNFTDETSKQGLNNYTIETTPYRSGLYILKVESSNVSKEIKVVIDK